jgi:hypothetical protein
MICCDTVYTEAVPYFDHIREINDRVERAMMLAATEAIAWLEHEGTIDEAHANRLFTRQRNWSIDQLRERLEK